MFAQSKTEQVSGIYSICSAHKYVIEAAMLQAKIDGTPLLLEATTNQVNQFGGYTGMNPEQFTTYIRNIAEQMDFPHDRIILGGDHLGPYVWWTESAGDAMQKAQDLVREYVQSGFTKIHIDTCMRCADDPGNENTPLDVAVIAERTANLCSVAESAFEKKVEGSIKPLYVIGTEVPMPGGAQEELDELQVTSVEDVQNTIEVAKQTFLARGLESAWDRVIAVVVQPGVEFNSTSIIDYDRQKAKTLSQFIKNYQRLVFEIHSTDYQTETSLRNLVEDQFAILKVGPWLTFAFRESAFALAIIESELLTNRKGITLSEFRKVIENVMRSNPKYWQKYYHENETEIHNFLKYSFSDRIRYYWQLPEVTEALNRLIYNLTEDSIPLILLSQYMPVQYKAVREGIIKNNPKELIYHRIKEITQCYSRACSLGES